MNQQLTKEYSENEVKTALKQMYPLKAPSPDGMPPCFSRIFSLPVGVWSLKQYWTS